MLKLIRVYTQLHDGALRYMLVLVVCGSFCQRLGSFWVSFGSLLGLFCVLTLGAYLSNKNKGLQDKYFKTLVRLYTSYFDEAIETDGGVPLPLAALETDLNRLEIRNPTGAADLRYSRDVPCVSRSLLTSIRSLLILLGLFWHLLP